MTTLRRSLTAAAAAALLLAPALAQSPTANAPASSAAAPSSTTGNPGFVAAQAKDQWLASRNLIGTKVTGPTNETVGSINDLLIDQNGTIVAAVVGVGGFLHIGEKNVAVPFKSLQMTRASDSSEKIAMRFSKDELQQAPTFHPLAPPLPPAMTMPGGTPRPRPSAPATQ
jgi:hypothetical protein